MDGRRSGQVMRRQAAPVPNVGGRFVSAADDDDDLDTLNRGALYKRKEFLGVEEEGEFVINFALCARA